MSVGPVRGVNSRPPTRQTGALQIDPTIRSYHKPTLNEFQVLNILNGEKFQLKSITGPRTLEEDGPMTPLSVSFQFC